MQRPLLVIYLLAGHTKEQSQQELPYRDGLLLPALGLHFPGSSDPDGSQNLVRYRINRVAQKELMPDDVDEDDLDATDPDD